MSRIKKIFTIIAGAFTLLFFKTIKVFADAPMPTASGSVPQSMYAAPPSLLSSIIKLIFFVILITGLPIYMTKGIIALVRINKLKKAKKIDANIDIEEEKRRNITKLILAIVAVVLIMIVVAVPLGVLNNSIDVDVTRTVWGIFFGGVMICFLLAYLISKIYLIRSMKTTQQQNMNQNQYPNQQINNQNTTNDNNNKNI